MQFKLINGDGSIRKHDIETLKEVLYNLQDTDDSFIILEPKQPIGNSIYLQAVKQEELYIAEIRFVFSNPDNYKHYSKVFENVDDLLEVFSAYYTNERIPDIKQWKDETELSDVDSIDMVKLYKKVGDTVYYFEIWLNDDDLSLTIHQGVLGDTGQTEDIIYDEEGDLPVKIAMAEIVVNQEKKGYRPINEMVELIVQYPSHIGRDNTKKENIEALLNECLGWTGNGHCESVDNAPNTLNYFCYVVDKQIATKAILEVLIEENYFDGVRIGYADESTGDYELLFPENGTFSLL